MCPWCCETSAQGLPWVSISMGNGREVGSLSPWTRVPLVPQSFRSPPDHSHRSFSRDWGWPEGRAGRNQSNNTGREGPSPFSVLFPFISADWRLDLSPDTNCTVLERRLPLDWGWGTPLHRSPLRPGLLCFPCHVTTGFLGPRALAPCVPLRDLSCAVLSAPEPAALE